jgi:hypothetical protein
VLLDALSVVSQTRNHDFARTSAALSTIEGGLLVLIAGRLTADQAREIAAARREGRQGIALLLAVSTWAAPPTEQNGHAAAAAADGAGAQSAASVPASVAAPALPPAETAAAEAVLRAAGWRVATVDASTPLAVAWQRLPRLGSHAVSSDLPTLGVVTR